MKEALEDPHIEANITIKIKAIADVVIASKKGLGKARHIERRQLRLQEKVRKGGSKDVKVRSNENLADALTKCVSKDTLRKHMRETGQSIGGGRHDLAPATGRW